MITFDFGYTDGTLAGQQIIANDQALNKEDSYQQNVMPFQHEYEGQRYALETAIDPVRYRNAHQELDQAFELNPYLHANNIQVATLEHGINPQRYQYLGSALAKGTAYNKADTAVVGNYQDALGAQFDASTANSRLSELDDTLTFNRLPTTHAQQNYLNDQVFSNNAVGNTLQLNETTEALKRFKDYKALRDQVSNNNLRLAQISASLDSGNLDSGQTEALLRTRDQIIRDNITLGQTIQVYENSELFRQFGSGNLGRAVTGTVANTVAKTNVDNRTNAIALTQQEQSNIVGQLNLAFRQGMINSGLYNQLYRAAMMGQWTQAYSDALDNLARASNNLGNSVAGVPGAQHGAALRVGNAATDNAIGAAANQNKTNAINIGAQRIALGSGVPEQAANMQAMADAIRSLAVAQVNLGTASTAAGNAPTAIDLDRQQTVANNGTTQAKIDAQTTQTSRQNIANAVAQGNISSGMVTLVEKSRQTGNWIKEASDALKLLVSSGVDLSYVLSGQFGKDYAYAQQVSQDKARQVTTGQDITNQITGSTQGAQQQNMGTLTGQAANQVALDIAGTSVKQGAQDNKNTVGALDNAITRSNIANGTTLRQAQDENEVAIAAIDAKNSSDKVAAQQTVDKANLQQQYMAFNKRQEAIDAVVNTLAEDPNSFVQMKPRFEALFPGMQLRNTQDGMLVFGADGRGWNINTFMAVEKNNAAYDSNLLAAKMETPEQAKQKAESHAKLVEKAVDVVNRAVSSRGNDVSTMDVVNSIIGTLSAEVLSASGASANITTDQLVSATGASAEKRMSPAEAIALARQLVTEFSPYRRPEIKRAVLPTEQYRINSDGSIGAVAPLNINGGK